MCRSGLWPFGVLPLHFPRARPPRRVSRRVFERQAAPGRQLEAHAHSLPDTRKNTPRNMEEPVPRTPLSRRDNFAFAHVATHDKAPVSPLLTLLRTPSVRNASIAGDGAPGNAKRTPTRGKVRQRPRACVHARKKAPCGHVRPPRKPDAVSLSACACASLAR
jgi:hypothetical protein